MVALGLSFAHTIGEFGVGINDRWQYSWRNSGAVYRAIQEQVEALEYNSAHNLALALLIFSFVMPRLPIVLTVSHEVMRRVNMQISARLSNRINAQIIAAAKPIHWDYRSIRCGKSSLFRALAGVEKRKSKRRDLKRSVSFFSSPCYFPIPMCGNLALRSVTQALMQCLSTRACAAVIANI